MKGNKFEVGGLYIHPESRLVVKCTDNNSIDGHFSGIVVDAGENIYRVGARSENWIMQSFKEYHQKPYVLKIGCKYSIPDGFEIIADDNIIEIKEKSNHT